ncbi:MAG: histidinol dehydrogenase [Porphyromonadaceae bacterium]|nr:histidinol dehydrogenase [Porphyromonadaceae bacterium]
MEVIKYPPREQWEAIAERPHFDARLLGETVSDILADVRQRGDAAVREYVLRFQKVELDSFEVTPAEMAAAETAVSSELKAAIAVACENITRFHASQAVQPRKVETTPGVVCWQKSVPIDRVGLYIPGGTAPLFSTVLMLAVPARVAGCPEVVLCTPCSPDGSVPPAVLYSAQVAGVKRIFKLGGVQAIGAMAYGTASVPRVYKIFGPGNQYVTEAKQQVSRQGVAIDMPAGPSEVAVVADGTSDVAFVASDFLSQCEHGADSQAVLFTTDESLIEPLLAEIERQLSALSRRELIEKSLSHSRIVLLHDREELVEMVNRYAPEHLIIESADYAAIAEGVVNAGSVFLGRYTPESAGDYASGTNHTLPTSGYARAYSGVNLDSFIRKITFQEISPEGLRRLGGVIETMAAQEGLDAHKNAVAVRLAKEQKKI